LAPTRELYAQQIDQTIGRFLVISVGIQFTSPFIGGGFCGSVFDQEKNGVNHLVADIIL